MNANIYTRKDGVVGVGFEIIHADRPQHSVAWPDKPAERYNTFEMERRGIHFEPLANPAETVKKTTVDELYEGGASEDPPEVTDEPQEDDAAPVSEDETTGASEQTTGAPEQTTGADSPEPVSEAEAIRQYLADHPDAHNKDVVAALAEKDIKVGSSQVSREKRKL